MSPELQDALGLFMSIRTGHELDSGFTDAWDVFADSFVGDIGDFG